MLLSTSKTSIVEFVQIHQRLPAAHNYNDACGRGYGTQKECACAEMTVRVPEVVEPVA